MGLRDLKRDGGYLQSDVPVGAWMTYGPGTLVRCPAHGCGHGLMQPDAHSRIRVRVATMGLGEPGEPSGFTLCPDNRCKARIQFRVLPAEG